MRLLAKLFTALLSVLTAGTLLGQGKASHVVVVVWDGMRPDFVREDLTPTLWKLSQRGVTFKNHHSVYISTTEVNGTALATGLYPQESGIIGNKEFRAAVDPTQAVHTESLAVIRKADALTGNRYIAMPTVAELLHAKGLRTAIAGSKAVALLHDRGERPEDALGFDVFAGSCLPQTVAARLTERLGPFPVVARSTTNWDTWTVNALLGTLWEKHVPPFSLLWLSEPDHSQHESAPGSPRSLAAVRQNDRNLARVLAALDQHQVRDDTDVIVVSDHGFSSIQDNSDIQAVLTSQGIQANRKFTSRGARDGDVFVIGNGGTVFLYVIGHDEQLIEKTVHCLQAQPFCGAVFTQKPVEGAFRLNDAKINSPAAPDIVVSLRWNSNLSTNGVPGMVLSDYGDYGPGGGMHGSLSPYDMHNTCVAAGPDFKKGIQDYLPTGNVDIAPTILWLLGVESAEQRSGRVLREALSSTPTSTVSFEPRHLEATYRGPDFVWNQYLNYSEVDGVLYFDEGNGSSTPDRSLGPITNKAGHGQNSR
jgi:predicted AlkP superfamily pyrophosphatase or phosphodiesterase